MAFGSFYQPWRENLCDGPEAWGPWMADLRATGVSRLIVQWVSWEHDWLFVSRPCTTDTANDDRLRQLLDAAAQHGISVWLGLDGSSYWWKATQACNSDVEVSGYLSWRAAVLAELAEALLPVTGHAAFGGWYLSDEIDDINWIGSFRAEALGAFLQSITASLKTWTPQKRIAISYFANGSRTNAEQCEVQWRRWFNAAPLLDEVLFQDGIGAGHNTLAQWPALLAAVSRAAATATPKRRCTPVVELFEPRQPKEADEPLFHPAPASRVEAQMALAKKNHQETVAFSVPDYVTRPHPKYTAQAEALRAWLTP